MLNAALATEKGRFEIGSEAFERMDNWIEQVGRRWGVDPKTLFHARVSMSELAANVLEHGMPTTSEIDVELRSQAPGLEIELVDTGRPFDPGTAQVAEPSPDRIGGRGLRLVRSFAHTIRYRRDQHRNVTTLQFVPEAEKPNEPPRQQTSPHQAANIRNEDAT